jgi:hypothetical protein
MAVAAEARQTVLEAEKYTHSLSTNRYLGQLAVEGGAEEEQASAEQLSYNEFVTGVAEHLKTDPELRGEFDVNTRYECPIIDGKACNNLGVPIVTVIENGIVNAAKAARTDPRMSIEQWRAEGDLSHAQRVDAMPIGTSRFALSMEPKRELAQDQKFWKEQGYRKGIAYFQWCGKDSDDKLVAGAISIDMSDEAAWHEMFAELGVDVPEDISPNEWIQYGFELTMDSAAAQKFALAIRQRYYDRVGSTTKRQSINEFMAERQHILKTNFEIYYKPLSQAIFTGQNNEVMQSFANTLLKSRLDNLKPELRQQLVRMGNSRTFDSDSGRLMDSLLQYAVAEQLRVELKFRAAGVQPQAVYQKEFVYVNGSAVPPEAVIQMLNQQHALGIEAGVSAGRSYGGCSGITLTKDSLTNVQFGIENPQDAFGGNAIERHDETTNDDCEFISKECPECKAKNVKTRVTRISESKKRIRGDCGCTKIASIPIAA